MVWSGKTASLCFIAVFWGTVARTLDTLKTQQLDSAWWANETKDLAYAPEKLPEFGEVPEYYNWFSFLAIPGIQWIVLILIIAVLLYVLYRLFGKEWFLGEDDESGSKHILTEDDLDERFYEMDLETLLKNALAKKRWALAIRIRFLLILKQLIEKEQIKWHKDLTNLQIACQLNNPKTQSKFKIVTQHFERAWYGDLPVTDKTYQQVLPDFESFFTIQPHNE